MKKRAGLLSSLGLVFVVACGQSDTGITTAVKTKMAADDTVKAYQVDVTTRNRVVTLAGKVNTSAAKERALVIARETDGVRDVIDRMTVTETAATSGLLERNGEPAVGVDSEVKADAKRGTHAAKRGGDSVADSSKRLGAATKDTAKSSAHAVADTSKHVGEATKDTAKDVGKATAKGAKKVGHAIKDAVTDDHKDSDHDGR